MAPAESWVDSSGAAKKPGVLPFYFVETDHLFDAALNDQIVSDLGLASGVLQNSHVLDAQQTVGAALAAVSPTFDLARIPAVAIPKLRIKRDPAVAEPVTPATPAAPSAPVVFDVAKPAPVAAFVSVAVFVVMPPVPMAADDDDAADEDEDEDDAKAAIPAPDADDDDDKDASNGRFATPPPDAHQIRDEVRRATRARVWRRIHRHFRVHPQGFQPHDAKCGWTMTYPSYWRCGY
jgi:hypothetical protein